MARRGSSGGGGFWTLVAVLVVIGLTFSAAEHHPGAFTLVVLLLIVGGIWLWRDRSKARKQEEAAAAAALEREKRRWREMPFPKGPCAVLLTSVRDADERLYGFLLNLSENPAVDIADPAQLIQRVEHIGRQPVARRNGLREPIPERVRHEVWRRDGGRCVDCGSRERLEFDHIVPISKGGANTARNIELRCEPCNRKKAATI